MARLPDPAQRPADLTALVKLGASDLRVWAIEFDPPPGPRGVQPGMKPTRWKCSISTQDAARPMISAVRGTALEAEAAAKALFVEMMGKRPGERVETFSDDAPVPKKAKPQPVVEDEDDSDIMDLV